MMTTLALQAPGPDAAFEQGTIERRDVGEHDVLIDIAFAGICHSDIHTVRGEWGDIRYPLTPGHEIAGTVSAVGSAVTRHGVGDRVGVGCMVESCGECEQCKNGAEQFCRRGATFTYNSPDPKRGEGAITQGGYAQQIVVDERFVCRIPEGIGLDVAAPLMCAGVTTFAPLQRWGVGPGSTVAVVGMGGLGHMGVKIAAAMGAQVTVLSRSLDKADDSRELGASDHVSTKDEASMKALRGSFDVILNTVSADLDLGGLLGLLKPFGVLVNVGLPNDDYAFPPSAVIGQSKVVAGSMIGGIQETQEMLDFCAEHGIGATIEVITADEVTEAYDKVVAGDVRYRYVIDTSTIGS